MPNETDPSQTLARPITAEEFQKCLQVLAALSEDPTFLSKVSPEDRILLMKSAGKIAHPTVQAHRKVSRASRKLRREARKIRDREARNKAGIREAREQTVFLAPKQIASSAPAGELTKPNFCYVCKQPFTQIHFFYD